MKTITNLVGLLLISLPTVLASRTKAIRAPYPIVSGDTSLPSSATGHNCDISRLTLPAAPTALPSPPGYPSHILIGRGVQNYTCDLSNTTAVPTPIGALATLYDASCPASVDPTLSTLNLLTDAAYDMRLSTLPSLSTDPTFAARFADAAMASSPVAASLAPYVIGHHFFTNSTTPRFDLDTANGADGTVTVSKVGISDAPAGSEACSVQWLYLPAVQGVEGQGYSAVYRVGTVGGLAPSTCKEAEEAAFSVRYAAQYWFYR